MIVERAQDGRAAYVSFVDGERVSMDTFLDDAAYGAAFADAYISDIAIDFTSAGFVESGVLGIIVLAKRMQNAKRGTLRVIGLSGPALDRARALGIRYAEENGGQWNGEENE